MEEMYEVLKFIEHDAHCRQSMDCVRGCVLLRYLKEHRRIEKTVLFSWFRELAVCVDQYHRSRNRQNYRYLNPCSIIVAEGKKLFLLDMEAPDNEAAMKLMQKRAVRSHFVRPVYEIGICRNNDADLFAYGRTIQFLLAYAQVCPPLRRREEIRLSGIIARCTGEARKKYEDLKGVLRDLPPVPEQKENTSDRSRSPGGENPAARRLPVIAAGSAAGIALVILGGVGVKGIAESRAAYTRERQAQQYAQQQEEEQREQEEQQRRKEAEQEQEEAKEREVLLDEAIEAYGKVLELEKDKEKIREAGMKKMELEMQKGDYRQALATAGTVAVKAGGSEELETLIGDCEENIP